MPISPATFATLDQTPEILQDSQFGEDYPNKGSDPTVLWVAFVAPSASLIYNTLEICELNLDGKPDILAAYDGQGLLEWLGDGDGNWANITTTPSKSGNYNDIAVADVNNDGKPDIIGARQGGISVWLGDGSGTAWSADTGPAVTATFNAIALADVNLDSNMDIVAAATGSGSRKGVQVFLGNGLGGWASGDTNLPLNQRFNGICACDFNRDGKPDIVAAGTSGVDAWTGNGAGSWTLSDSGLPSSGSFSDAAVSDFDSDGCLDIVASGDNNNGVITWKGNGAGMWTVSANLPLVGTYTSVETCDINIDGYSDILTASSNSDQVVWTGDGKFNWYLQTDGLPSGNAYSDMAIGDIDLDGHTDVAMARTSSGIDIFRSTAFRTVNRWDQFPAPVYSGTVTDIEMFDVNLDGKKDIAYATQANGIRIWTGDGTGNWTDFASPLSTGTVNSISITDYNNDGNPDIVATQSAGIRAWRGNAAGTWVLSTPSPSGTWFGLTAADFNDDGFIDIAAGSGTNSGLFVWNGNGAGVWTITFNLPFTGTYYELDSADMNNDGSLDLVAANGGLKVFLGNSNNGWTDSSSGLPDSAGLFNSVRIYDMDRNGKPDILGGSESSGAKIWYGNGAGTWNSGEVVSAAYCRPISVCDFTIDGSADACVGSSQNLGLGAFRSTGAGWAPVAAGLSSVGDYTAMCTADINQDGRFDIVAYNNSGQTSRIWTGGYEPPAPDNFMVGPLSVGWNLVSVPLNPLNKTMPGALNDLDGDTYWTTAKIYNATDPADHWKSYSPGRPSVHQDFQTLESSFGVWILIENASCLGDGYIKVQGYAPETTEIRLVNGWNLVGYPSESSSLASLTLPSQADTVSVWQASSPYISDRLPSAVTMTPGGGYWVHAISDCIWSVGYYE